MTTWIVVLTGMACCGLVFFCWLQLRRLQSEAQARTNKRQQTIQAELGRLRGEIEAMRERLEEAERRAASGAIPPRSLKGGLNLSQRTHAIRMLRRGETAAQVAEELGLPQSEVELLIKVQRILATEAATTA